MNDSRVLKEATSLASSGYKVTVVALHNDELPEREVLQGIDVHRIKLVSRNWSKMTPIKLLKYLELSIKMIKKYKEIDIIHCNDIGPLPIAYIIKTLTKNKVKIIYDAHEYETEMNGLKGLRKKVVSIIERFLINKVDKVITVSNSIANEYVRLYNIEKPGLVLNCPHYKEISAHDKFREKFLIEKNVKIFLYQGSLTKGRGLELILEVFTTIHKEAVLVVMGYGPLVQTVVSYSEKYSNIFYHEAVSPDVLLQYTSSADIGICLIEDVCLSYRYSLPNKFFEYAMAGLPIITNNLIEVKQIAEKYRCGWVMKEDSPNILKGLVNEIVDMDLEPIKENVKRMTKEYNWENQEKVLLNIYAGVHK